jgi:molecular chaperone GrpE
MLVRLTASAAPSFFRRFATTVAPPPPPPKKPYEELEKELIDLRTEHLYTVAELENTRRRFVRQRTEIQDSAVESMAKRLLSVADNIGRIRQAGEKQTTKALLEAVSMVESDLSRVFEDFKIKKMKTAGVKFSPEFHEAVTVVKTEKPEDAGVILSELAPGYTIAGKLLRAARVAVGK